MKFSKEFIPDSVWDNVVYKDDVSGVTIIATNGKIHNGLENLSKKQTHELIKNIVSSNKTEVFEHLLNQSKVSSSCISLHLGDLVYLACQHGGAKMVETIMNEKSKVSKYLSK